MGKKLPNAPSPPQPWTVYTCSEVAQMLKLSSPTVRGLERDGEIDALPGIRTLRFTAQSLHDYLQKKRKP